jgi:hypothetical protein
MKSFAMSNGAQDTKNQSSRLNHCRAIGHLARLIDSQLFDALKELPATRELMAGEEGREALRHAIGILNLH